MLDLLCLLIENGPLAIDAGRHPILESVHNDFVVRHTPLFHEFPCVLEHI